LLGDDEWILFWVLFGYLCPGLKPPVPKSGLGLKSPVLAPFETEGSASCGYL